MKRRAFLLATVLSAWTAACTPALAKNDGSSGGSGRGGSGRDDDDDQHDESARREAGFAVEKGEIAPLSDIARIALAHTPGKIIDVKLRHEDTLYIYRIRILARNGRSRELFIDARSRTILSVK